MTWIKCSERMPEDGFWCLLYLHADDFTLGTRIGKWRSKDKTWKIYLGDYLNADHVTHWAELPEPPKDAT
jgi:hypothetical protein